MSSAQALNQAIQAFQTKRTEENVMKVIFQLMEMTQNEEEVLTPVKLQPRYYKEKADAEALYKVVTDDANHKLHVCYTTVENAAAAKEDGSLTKIKWKDMLLAVVRQPAVEGLAVNPHSWDFVLNKQLCGAILQELKLM